MYSMSHVLIVGQADRPRKAARRVRPLVLHHVLNTEGQRLNGSPLREAEAVADPEARLLAVAVARREALDGVGVVLMQVEAKIAPRWPTVLE